MLADLTDRTALVTGAAKGIGRGIALALAQQGADVALADVDAQPLSRVRQEVEALGRRALALQMDVTSQTSVDEGVRETFGSWERVDVLVNNAGIGSPSRSGPEGESEGDWEKILAVNLMGVVRCTQAIVPSMKERRYGKIINIASMAGHAARRMGGAYATSKAAVLRYSKGLASELAPSNINVNAICPGAVWTAFQEQNIERRIDAGRGTPEGDALARMELKDAYLEVYQQVIPLGRDQTPEDIGRLAAFLASEDARNITGQCIHVDGGAVLRD